MQLSDIQERFRKNILSANHALDDVLISDHIALDERLSIYRGNVMSSLSDVLLKTFPVVEDLVGEEFMTAMVRAYITENLPDGGCLNEYGSSFPAFVTAFEPAQSLPYLPDVARFEWALHAAYYAKDDQALTAEELAAIAPESLGDLQLTARDSVTLIQSPYPLTAIRDFCSLADKGEATLDLDQGGVKLMVYRPKLKIEALELDEASFLLLSALKDAPLGPAVEAVLEKFEDFDFQAFLQAQLQMETFLTLKTNS